MDRQAQCARCREAKIVTVFLVGTTDGVHFNSRATDPVHCVVNSKNEVDAPAVPMTNALGQLKLTGAAAGGAAASLI